MLLTIIVFITVMGLTMMMFSMFGKSSTATQGDRIRDRLLGKRDKKTKSSSSGAAPTLIKSEEPQTGLANKVLNRLDLADRINALIEQSGLKWTAASLIQSSLVAALVAFNVFWYMLPPPIDRAAFLAAIAGFFLPFLYVKQHVKKRMRKFEEQFPESLEFVARSMRAGHAFSVSLEMIHREFSEPLAGEYRRTFDEQNLGLPLDIALQNLAKRVPLLEVQFFVSAVLLQKRTGGNLAELLDKLAYLIRERFKLRGRIRAVSAHGKMTATALSAIPVFVAALMFLTNPEYVGFFIKDETGQMMAGAAVGIQLIGYAIMKKIVNIEV